MRFSTQNLLSLREGQSHAQVYANTLDECRLAEELGFHTVWLAEHHFSPYGIAPSLPVLAAAVARETRRVRIGTAVVVAPFAHPIRIAEEWAMVDILSEGRLDFGIGRGYQPAEFRGRARDVPIRRAGRARRAQRAASIAALTAAASRAARMTATPTAFTPRAATCATARFRPPAMRTSSMVARIHVASPSRICGASSAEADHSVGSRSMRAAASERSDHVDAVRRAASLA